MIPTMVDIASVPRRDMGEDDDSWVDMTTHINVYTSENTSYPYDETYSGVDESRFSTGQNVSVSSFADCSLFVNVSAVSTQSAAADSVSTPRRTQYEKEKK